MSLRGDNCQCAGCGLYFKSTKAFDKHRRGTPGKDRRCLAPTEMLLKGMATDKRGFWVTARRFTAASCTEPAIPTEPGSLVPPEEGGKDSERERVA